MQPYGHAMPMETLGEKKGEKMSRTRFNSLFASSPCGLSQRFVLIVEIPRGGLFLSLEREARRIDHPVGVNLHGYSQCVQLMGTIEVHVGRHTKHPKIFHKIGRNVGWVD